MVTPGRRPPNSGQTVVNVDEVDTSVYMPIMISSA